MGLAETMEQVARGVEVVGIATLVLGLVVALIQAARVAQR
jgi:flagellar biosynthesis protein FliQ